MKKIRTLDELHALYDTPPETSLSKVADRLIPVYRRWVEEARFCILSTVGPEGTDASPRGDDGPVVAVLDESRLALPDWHGNQRLDSLRNIVRDPRLSLMFMVPGSTNVLRINGTGAVTDDAALREGFARKGRLPRTVVLVDVGEVYFQCARAIMRARLWDGAAAAPDLPTAGQMLAETTGGAAGGAAYDARWPARAAESLW